jgi:DNA invertase Pin-like site-specific DNA recombinase
LARVPAKTKPQGSRRAARGSRRRRRRPAAIGYASVPPELELDGAEVQAQRKTIERACRELGLDLVDLLRDHEPHGGEAARPGLMYALERMGAGEATCLVVSGIERLSGSPDELATVLDRLEREDGRLVAVDIGLDTETPAGHLAVARRPGVPAPPAPEPIEPAEPPEEPVEPPAPAPARRPAPASVRALGYASVSADDPTEELTRQAEAIERRCERLGLELVEVVREREPKAGKALNRAGITYLIERLAAGDASCLVVSGLDRLSHSVAELGTLVQWLEKSDVRLVAVELDLDTVSPGGRAAARALASVGGWERERLSERTRKGLAAARAKRHSGGAATSDWTAIRKRIAVMRADGMTLQAIADALNEEGVPTPRGGAKWRPSSVQTAAGYKRRSRTKDVDDLPSVERPPRP